MTDYILRHLILFILFLFVMTFTVFPVAGHNEVERLQSYYMNRLEENPRDHKVLNNLGVVFFDKRQYNKATEIFRKTIKIKKDYYNAWYNLGITRYALGDWPGLVTLTTQALEIFEDSRDDLLLIRCYAEYRIRRFDKCVRDFEAVDRKKIDKELTDLFEHMSVKVRAFK